MKILGISGSLRRGSYNTSLLSAAASLLPADVEFELWGGLKEVPPYDEDDDTEEAPAAATTGAFGAVWSQAELRKVLAATGARVVEGEVAVGHAPTRFDEEGRLVDENLLEQLEEVVAVLVAAAAARCEAPDSHLASAGLTA